MQVSTRHQSPLNIIIKHKESSLHVRLKHEWLQYSWLAHNVLIVYFYCNQSRCQNIGPRVDAKDITRQRSLLWVYWRNMGSKLWKSIQITTFKCQWVKHPQGVEVDDYGFTFVDLINVGHKDDPWVS
jgi:hypothetical protein